MIVRGGGGNDRVWHVRYVDIFDIVKLLGSIHGDKPRVTYNKSLRRIR
jgi:hypothetical protein